MYPLAGVCHPNWDRKLRLCRLLSGRECGQPLASEMGAEHHGNRSIGRVDVEIFRDNFRSAAANFRRNMGDQL